MTRKKGFLVFLSGMVAVLSSGCSGRVPWVSAAGETREEVQETTANRLEAVQQLGELRIGISADYAPFAFQVQTEGETFPWAGADVELGRYIAKEMGVEAEFCEMGFEDCLAAVAEGSVDMVLLGMLPTSDRDTVMDYTDIYYEPGKQVVLIKETQEKKLSKPEDFEEKTVAAQYGSLQAQLLAEQFPGSWPEFTEDASEAVLKLRLGIVDGVILEEAMAEAAVEEFDELAVSKAVLPCPSSDTTGVVGGVVKGETELLEKVNSILGEVSDRHLYLEWLDAVTAQAAALTHTIP